MSESYERYGGYEPETTRETSEDRSVGGVLRRHYVASRVLFADLVLFGLAAAVLLSTGGPLGNVVFAILVSSGVMLTGAMALFGAFIKVDRWRRG